MRLRFRIRSLMLTVAVVAVIFGGAHLWQKAIFYQGKVRHYRQMESSVIGVIRGPKPIDSDELGRVQAIWTAYHSAMRIKYEHAASRPWAYVPPDPPEPVLPSDYLPMHFDDR
jgi:hypothetical protein